ncbi:MAG: hypothetical protein WC346_04060 [Methanogenium sp.]|jgi:hypothetical protein
MAVKEYDFVEGTGPHYAKCLTADNIGDRLQFKLSNYGIDVWY